MGELLFQGDGGLTDLIRRGDHLRAGLVGALKHDQVGKFGRDIVE
jgi:hypothetical protein